MRAQAVALARRDAGDEAVEDVAGARGQPDALQLGRARGVEDAEVDRRRVGRDDGDVHAAGFRRDAERLGRPGPARRIGSGRALRRQRAEELGVLPRGARSS